MYVPYLLIPYKAMGRSWDGADCYGLIMLFYEKEFGIKLKDSPEEYDIPPNWVGRNYFTEYYEYVGFSKSDTCEKGTWIFFKDFEDNPIHCGVAVNDSEFLHMTTAGCLLNNYRFSNYTKRIHSMYSYVGPQ